MSAVSPGADQRTAAPKTERRFFAGMAIAVALTVFAGFAPSYFLRGHFGLHPPAVGPHLEYADLTPLLHVHGFIFTAWILLLVTQTQLVARGRTDLHRRLGWVGAFLVAAMIVLGFLVGLWSARRGFTPPGGPPPLVFLVVPYADLAVFASLAVTGIVLRRRSEAHKRLMLLATIAMLPEAIARLPFVLPLGLPAFYGLTYLFVVACIVYDRRTRGRVHPAFKWGSLAIVLSLPLRIAIASTGAWLAFATWLTR
jgi:hypothetical protein